MKSNKKIGVITQNTWSNQVTDDEKKNMIAACACRIAEERGFDNFSSEVDPAHDWEIATAEVNRFLAEGKN